MILNNFKRFLLLCCYEAGMSAGVCVGIFGTTLYDYQLKIENLKLKPRSELKVG